MLSEVSQPQDKHCMIPIISDILNSQIHRSREQNNGCQGQSEGKLGCCQWI